MSTTISATATHNKPDLKTLLKRELMRRCRLNSRYSLRSFAKNLGVSPADLSRVMSGKRAPSIGFTSKVASALKIAPKELAQIAIAAKVKESHLPEFDTLELETLEALSDCNHHALFELIDTSNFKSDSRWIAKRLKLSLLQVEDIISRLEALGLITKKPSGKILKLKQSFATTGHSFTAPALKTLQKEFLTKALLAIDEVPLELRSQTTMTMAIDRSRLTEARERIQKFRYEMNDFLSNSKTKEEVYSLSIALFPLSDIITKTNKEKK